MSTRAAADGPLLHVRVQPRASRSELAGWQGTTLRVRVTAAPTEGRANRAVAELLAAACGVPVGSVELVRGATSRDKLYRVGALSADAVKARLSEALA
jgi:hypothetical protein